MELIQQLAPVSERSKNAVQTVPTNFVAWIASFAPRDFLSVPASDRDVPEIELDDLRSAV